MSDGKKFNRLRTVGPKARLIGLFLSWLLLSACQEQTPFVVGGAAPELAVLDLQEQPVKLADYQGQVVLLQFWTGGCGACLAEMPILGAFYQSHKAQGVTVLSVNLGGELAEIQALVERLKLPFPVLSDRLQITAQRYEVAAVPALFILDRDGILREKFLGEVSDTMALEAKVSPWLSQDDAKQAL